MAPQALGAATMQDAAPSRRSRWGWVGGLTLIIVAWQLATYAKPSHLTFHGFDYGQALASLPIFLLIGVLAPLVSYRRRDALLLLVPIYNLVILWRIGTRLVRLPDRDWPQRPDSAVAYSGPPE